MPSPAILADQGSKALSSQQYALAIDLYTQALQQTPGSPDYYLKRSTAYQRSSDYPLALRDAELAVVLAHKRGKRELIGNAQLRRGISLLMVGKLGDAGFCFNEAEKKASNDKDKNLIGVWKSKLEMQLAKVDEDDVTREVTAKEIPDIEMPKSTCVIEKDQIDLPEQKNTKATIPAISPPEAVITPPSKIRHEWYQTATHVVLTIYVKGVPKDRAIIEIKEKSVLTFLPSQIIVITLGLHFLMARVFEGVQVSIAFPLPSGHEFTFDLDPLCYSIKAEESTFAILSTKIEVKIAKKTLGQKWADLEAPQIPQAPEFLSATDSPRAAAISGQPKNDLPVYPTSSKSGPKDWDKVAKELTSHPKKKDRGIDGKQDGEVEDDGMEYESDYEGGDPVNHFFKKLYKDADEDTRRAMMKSYVESNGTALSTNWKEVGKAPVETSPPDGMIAHKWSD